MLVKNEINYFRRISIKTCYKELNPFCSFLVLCKMGKDAEGSSNSSKSNTKENKMQQTYKVISVSYINTLKKENYAYQYRI